MRSRRTVRRRVTACAVAAASLGLVTGVAGPAGPAGAAAPPTPLVGLTPTGQLVRFDASVPGAFGAVVPVTGLQPGEVIVGFDVRPATGELIGIGVVGTTGRVYVIDPASGAATAIGAAPFSTTLPAGGSWTVDFNPTVDRIRFVHSSGTNLRVNQTNGTLAATDTPISGGTASALAYDRSVAGTTGTTLYVIDSAADRLATMGSVNSAPQSPNGGVLNTVGPLGVDSQALTAMDIAPSPNAFGTAIAAMQVNGAPVLGTIDLRTGAATVEGALAGPLLDLAVLAPTPVVALTATGAIVRFDASSPGVVSTPTAITGLRTGETIVGFDVRPATGQLIGLGVVGGEGRIYSINAASGAATQIGATPFSTALPADGAWTVDFNPTVDRIRVIHTSGLNLRLNPDSGARADTSPPDTAISGGTVDAGAYDRSIATATGTSLYGIDATADTLVTVGGVDQAPSPNLGAVSTVGPLGVDATGLVGFDIAPSAAPRGRAFAAIQVAATTGIYSVDLLTGAASPVGLVGAGSLPLRDLAVMPAIAAGASQFTVVDPTRLLDTREGGGAKPAAGSTVELQVTGGVVPVNATAVVLNVVGTEATDEGFVTVYPTGEARPLAANQNLAIGMTRGNLVTAKIGAGGKVSVYTQSGTHLVADLYGYYAPPTGTAGRFTALPPARLVDTRTTAKVPAGGSIDVQVTGVGGVPTTGVSSVVVNVTAVEADGPGFVTGHATGKNRPFTASLNVERPGQTIGNLTILPIGTDGRITLYSQSGTHLVVDVAGWFGNGSSRGGTAGLYVPLTPARVLDTRDAPNGKVAAGASLDLAIAGAGGVPAAGASAAVMNVTATEVTAPGFVTVFPTGTDRQEVSSLYADTAGQIIPSLVSSRLGTGGRVTVFSNAGTHVVVDLAGWYTS